ncbi:MAG: hypothetical protein JWN93_3516 [Hyphomicrobiales bacterium]|jgi:hypothetical protein|nr:hypothetical protein [Hyphomicrobiales bacterium]
MSSPERAKSGAKPGLKPAPKAAKAKAAPAKAVAKSAPAPARAAKAAGGAGRTAPADKAAFLKAMAKGVAPNSAASRKLVEKKGSPFAPAPAAQAPRVEVLRRIPAPPVVVNTPESDAALQLAAAIERMLETGDMGKLQPHAQQALVASLCKLYAANQEAGERYAILGGRTLVAATDVMVVCGALLKAVDLQVFELGMWQSWSAG